MVEAQFPRSQGDLLKAARGGDTQAAFAKKLGINKTSWSRYESEKIGAPIDVLNYCLKAVSERFQDGNLSAVEQALDLVRRAAHTLERAVP